MFHFTIYISVYFIILKIFSLARYYGHLNGTRVMLDDIRREEMALK